MASRVEVQAVSPCSRLAPRPRRPQQTRLRCHVQHPPTPSDIALRSPESGIVDIMNYGRRKGGVMPLWAGEGDLPTPVFIAEAATASLAKGETFYTWQRGLPELREALAAYTLRLTGQSLDA
jgi:hypothetical protein